MDDPIKPIVQVPTLAGDRSSEAPVLLVDPQKDADVAREIMLRNKERKDLGFEAVRFYIRHKFFG